MPAKQHHVQLTAAERQELQQMVRRGNHSARERTRKRFVAMRLGTLTEQPRPGRRPVLAAKGEARLIAEACSTAPGGRERWTLQLLADRGVELQLAEACSKDTVGRVLKKTRSSPGSSRSGVFPK